MTLNNHINIKQDSGVWWRAICVRCKNKYFYGFETKEVAPLEIRCEICGAEGPNFMAKIKEKKQI